MCLEIDQLLTQFKWVGTVPHLAKSTMQLTMSEGGLALPNFKFYYWAVVTVRWRFGQLSGIPMVNS